MVQDLFTWMHEDDLCDLCVDHEKALPVRRFFEQQWEHCLPKNASRVERLSALATEANVRVTLPNDFLFKVDIASLKESLEVRVPMLDEDLFSFAVTLPHKLKVKGRECKQVLREVAARQLPLMVAKKAKHGFAVPVDRWVNAEFRSRVSCQIFLGRSSMSRSWRRFTTIAPTDVSHGKPYFDGQFSCFPSTYIYWIADQSNRASRKLNGLSFCEPNVY